MKNLIIYALAFLLPSLPALAAVYHCNVSGKEPNNVSLTIEDGNPPYLSRCGYSPSEKKETCDKYTVDKVVIDENTKARKYYVFDNQYDVQLFSDLSFIENTGRSIVNQGKCALK